MKETNKKLFMIGLFGIFIFLIPMISCNQSNEQVQFKKVYDFPVHGELYSEDDFVKIDIPVEGTAQWKEFMRVNDKFVAVSFYKNRLFLSEFSSNINYTVEYADGFLKGTNHGEFGGGLYFIPFDKDKEIIELFPINISFIFEFKDEVYAFAGGGHITDNAKSLMLKIVKNKTEYKAEVMCEISCRPFDILVDNERIFVLGHNKLIEIQEFKERTVYDHLRFYNFTPMSLTIDAQDNLYMGFRGGYAKLNLTSKELEFYRLKGEGPSLEN